MMANVELIIIPLVLIPFALNALGIVASQLDGNLVRIVLATGAGWWIVELIQKIAYHGHYTWGIDAVYAILTGILFISVWMHRKSSHISARTLLWLYGGGIVVGGSIFILNMVRF